MKKTYIAPAFQAIRMGSEASMMLVLSMTDANNNGAKDDVVFESEDRNGWSSEDWSGIDKD